VLHRLPDLKVEHARDTTGGGQQKKGEHTTRCKNPIIWTTKDYYNNGIGDKMHTILISNNKVGITRKM
jgi:hypothetical protein